MLLKTIKGILQILLLLVILLPLTAYFMLKLPPIQTYIVQRITDEISQITKTKVSIKSVNYKFFTSLVIDEFYVEDTEGDTLANIAEVEAKLASIWFSGKKINLSSIKLTNGQFNLITTNDTLNLDKFLARLSSNDTVGDTVQSKAYSLSTGRLELSNFRFSLQNRDDRDEAISSQINFSDLRVDSIYLTANNIKIVSDTVFFDISHLGFREKSGFHLVEISTGKKSYVCSHRAYLPELSIIDDYTNLKFDYYAMNFPNGSDDIDDYLNKVRMEANITGGYLAFKTIGFFAHDLAKVDITVFPQGKVNGTVADMHTENFNIKSVTGYTSLTGNFSFKGLPEIDSTVFTCNNINIATNIKDVNSVFKQIAQTGEDVLGEEFEPVTNINYSGELLGYYNNFLIKGMLNTNLGTVETKTEFDFSSAETDFKFNGDLILANFDLGKLLSIENIKNVSMNMKIHGAKPVNDELKMYAESKISNLFFNDRKYNNIDIVGNLSNNAFNGKVACNDEDLKFDFFGNINMNKTEKDDYRFVFTTNVTYADLYKLKIKTDDTTSVFSGKIVADLHGKNINFNGTLKLQNAKYRNSHEVINMEEILLKAKQTGNDNSILLESSYFDAEYKGNDGFGGFVSDVKHIISKYIPTVHKNENYSENGNYELNVTAKKIQNIVQIIYPELFIAENTVANLKVEKHTANLDLKSAFIGLGGIMIKNINLKSIINSKFLFDADCEEMNIKGLDFKNLSVTGNIDDNAVLTTIKYDNKTENINRGNINLQTQILNDSNENIYCCFKIKPSQIIINSTVWDFALDEMKIKKNFFEISKFDASSGSQRIFINGIYSTIPNTSMRLELTKFDMANFNPIFETEGYKFEGNIFGNAQIANIGGNTMFFSDINTTDIFANNWLLGKISILSRWKEETKSLEFSSQIIKNKNEKLNIRGSYTPNKDYYDLTFDAKKFELKIAEALISSELNKLEGSLSGTLNLKGEGGKLNLLGNATLDSVGFTVDFLKTHYLISTPINFVENAIKIQNATLYDMQNNKGRLNASVNHEHLRNFVFDINVNADKLSGLNTTRNDNDEFYGNAYISGFVRMNGKLEDLNFNINVRPEKNTKIVIPVNSANISEKTLLTFETGDSVNELSDEEKFMTQIKKNKETSTTKSDLDISLAITMNRNAEIQIILDENSGDAITGIGSGALQMSINPSEEKFKLYGNYIIESGNFKWTLPMLNFMTKEFAINSGSQINFNGDMNATKINITADYVRTLRLSLRNLLADTTISNTKYPVVCRIQLTGNIFNFMIKPVIEIQNIDVDTKARALSMLNTDEKLWKQFSFLLAFGNFIPEEQMGNIITNANITSNISEILSNQLSAWLASLKVPVDLGVDIRTGNASTETEFDAHASIKMFEDRVEITGNVGSAPRTSTSDIAGNFDVEIKLNPQGSLKFKAFSHSTDEYTDDMEASRQGGRISYQGGFNTWKELWNSIVRPKQSLRQRRERIRQRLANEQNPADTIQKNANEFEIKPDGTTDTVR